MTFRSRLHRFLKRRAVGLLGNARLLAHLPFDARVPANKMISDGQVKQLPVTFGKPHLLSVRKRYVTKARKRSGIMSGKGHTLAFDVVADHAVHVVVKGDDNPDQLRVSADLL